MSQLDQFNQSLTHLKSEALVRFQGARSKNILGTLHVGLGLPVDPSILYAHGPYGDSPPGIE